MAELYLMNVSEAERIPAAYCLERFPRRYERAEKYKNKADTLRSVAAGALVAGVLGVGEDEISHGEWGKPYLPGGDRFFSLSHSGEYALLAVSYSDIGADIEKVTVYRDAVARRVFTPDEREWIRQDPDRRFFELWTAKESVIKLDGRGLSLGMETFFALDLVRGGTIMLDDRKVYGYSTVFGGYCISACACEKLTSPPLTVITAEDLI